MDGGNRMGLPQTQAPELAGHRQALLGRLALVHRQQHRHLLGAQPIGDPLVCGGEPLLAIDDHHGHGGLRQGQVGLLANLRQKLTVVVEHQTAGVHHHEGAIPPKALLVGAIAGHPRLVMHDRLAAAAESVDQGGLAHVGAANDGDDRKRQTAYPLLHSSSFDPTWQPAPPNPAVGGWLAGGWGADQPLP